MSSLIKGKVEIIYLLNKCISKYQLETGKEIIQNTNRKNYEGLALVLSQISNELPFTAEKLGHIVYSPDHNPNNLEFPYRKYDITGGQIKDAVIGIVSNPRPFLVDACYIYLYNIGRKAFELNPIDENLLANNQQASSPQNGVKKFNYLLLLCLALIICLIFSFYQLNKINNYWNTIKTDMNLLPYQPTQAEIDSLQGLWLCYTGSPQARISDANRYHKVVSNLVNISYKNGYFTFDRYGANFDHIGYIQFESPNLISIYSRINTGSEKVASPRHSLMNLNSATGLLNAISASWNFDVGEKNKIIGIREVYIKQGKGGTIEEVMNSVENASCQCKIVKWHKPNNEVQVFYLKNELLDSIQNKSLIPLINENSILLSDLDSNLIISKGFNH
jgi:hypothetical protein